MPVICMHECTVCVWCVSVSVSMSASKSSSFLSARKYLCRVCVWLSLPDCIKCMLYVHVCVHEFSDSLHIRKFHGVALLDISVHDSLQTTQNPAYTIAISSVRL